MLCPVTIILFRLLHSILRCRATLLSTSAFLTPVRPQKRVALQQEAGFNRLGDHAAYGILRESHTE